MRINTYFILSKYESSHKNDKCRILTYLASRDRLETYLGPDILSKLDEFFREVPRSKMVCIEKKDVSKVLETVSTAFPKERFTLLEMCVSYEVSLRVL